jgi:predicted dehydrogenase/threonine dehydrogenase-like Zn-dependent dehydrogenase
MLVEFGRSNLLSKARQQPDKVKQVLDKVRTDGLVPTLQAVRSKIEAPIPLGYCHAGVVVEVGAKAQNFQIGDRVASNGPHAEFVRVPWTLAAKIPDGVSDEAAAFTPLAAIGLQGLRLAAPTLGETVVVYGLGLIGLLTAQLARAAGCRVIGVDTAADRLELAKSFGAEPLLGQGNDVPGAVLELTNGLGADAVLLTLAADSDEPIHLAAEMCRKRGRIVLVGVTGLNIRRDDFYRKELTFQVSCSYGPGRYDDAHEDGGIDYPPAFVRWTEGRNFGAVLALMGSGALDPKPLISHRFAFDQAASGYQALVSGERALGIVLTYPTQDLASMATQRIVTVSAREPEHASAAVVGFIGAGNFASRTLVPAFTRAGAQLRTVASSGGTSAAIVAKAHGALFAASSADAVIQDKLLNTVVVTTRHDSHARFVLEALRAGKHVFVEKPLALHVEEVDRIGEAARSSGRLLCVGFNRRYAPLTQAARRALGGRIGPLVVDMTVNAGALPPDHWTKNLEVGGGRVIGEACHFVDLARYLVGAPITDAQVMSARARSGSPIEDVTHVQLQFADGSMSSISYVANGHRAYPKERVELFWDGRILAIDNFRRITGWGVASSAGVFRRQDKGHANLAAAFVKAIKGEQPSPIPLEELLEVSRWAVRIGRRAAGLVDE